MGEPFSTRLKVRGYEVDINGHVNQAVYLQYAEHTRWECLAAAGFAQDKLAAAGIGPVTLETTIHYLSELRTGDEIDVSLAFEWGQGKTFRIRQNITRPDGRQVAKITSVGGVLDLASRRLAEDPKEAFRSLASRPEVLGL